MPDSAASAPRPLLTITDAVILSMVDGEDWFRGWISVGVDGRISGLGVGDAPADALTAAEVVDAAGAFVAPGFVSAHSHIFTSGMRGMTPGDPLYGWVGVQAQFMSGTDADDVYWMTLHGSLDFLVNGVTSAYNFLSSRFHSRYDAASDSRVILAELGPEYVYRQVDAGADANLRLVNAVRIDSELQSADRAHGVFADAMDYVRTAIPRELDLGGSVFGAQQWSDSPETAAHEAAMMDAHGVSNQAHFLETSEALDQQREKFDWYERSGALRPGFLFGHFVHPDEHMSRTAAERGAGMVWQPASNGRLASGFADIPRYRELGMPIGVGLDDQSCTDISDPFQNMRIGMYAQRALHRDAAIIMPREMIRMHTLGGAEALGVGDRIGSLAVGKFADLVIVDPRHPDTGPVWDPFAHYAFACGLRNLTHVYVGGRLVARDGVSTHPLAATASLELHDRVRSAAARAGLAADLAW